MATKRTMKYGATISIPMKNISTASDEIISNLKNEKSSLLKKVGKPTSNAIVWSIITAAFMMSIIVITGSAVAIEKSAENTVKGDMMDKSMIVMVMVFVRIVMVSTKITIDSIFIDIIFMRIWCGTILCW